MSSTILILHPNTPSKTGNHSTAQRISDSLKTSGYKIICMDVQSALSQPSLHQYLIIISIHALHSHILLQKIDKSTQKFLLIFGGTDINEYYKNADSLDRMTETVQAAQKCVAFSEYMRDQAASIWPEYRNNFVVIHQGVTTVRSVMNWRKYLSENHHIASEKVLLLVAGIRPVKDPLFILQQFKEWRTTSKTSCSLVIVGPILNEEYGKRFIESMAQYSNDGVIYIGELSTHDTHAAIAQSDIIINSSISEGMAATILEAFDLGTPVIARNNSGNSSLIRHEANGLLFNTPQECMNMVASLLEDSHLELNLVRGGIEDIRIKYNTDIETRKYETLLNLL